jgi:hypothetical protein
LEGGEEVVEKRGEVEDEVPLSFSQSRINIYIKHNK